MALVSISSVALGRLLVAAALAEQDHRADQEHQPAAACTTSSGRNDTACPSSTATRVCTRKARLTPIQTGAGGTRREHQRREEGLVGQLDDEDRRGRSGRRRRDPLRETYVAGPRPPRARRPPAGRARSRRRATSSYSGCALTTHAVVAGELDADGWPPTSTATNSRSSACLVDRLLAQPDRGGLPEDLARGRRRRAAGVDQHAQGVRRPALLHQDRGQPGVARRRPRAAPRSPPATPAGRGRRRCSPAAAARWSRCERSRASTPRPTNSRSTLACPVRVAPAGTDADRCRRSSPAADPSRWRAW